MCNDKFGTSYNIAQFTGSVNYPYKFQATETWNYDESVTDVLLSVSLVLLSTLC